MKTRETIDAIGFVTVTTLLTAGVAVAGIVQVAAAGVDLLVAAPFAQARKAIRPAPTTRPVEAPKPFEVRVPQAA